MDNPTLKGLPEEASYAAERLISMIPPGEAAYLRLIDAGLLGIREVGEISAERENDEGTLTLLAADALLTEGLAAAAMGPGGRTEALHAARRAVGIIQAKEENVPIIDEEGQG